MGVDGPVRPAYGVWRHIGRIGHIPPDLELALFANTEAEYTAAIARWSEISRQTGTEFIAVFDIPVDHPLETELDQIYKAT